MSGRARGGGAPPPDAALSVVPSGPPPHKLIPGTGFMVDSFFRQWGQYVKAYFLSHAHSDHYGGLTERWAKGPIYCNAVTARLVQHLTGVGPQYLAVLPMDTPVVVHGEPEVPSLLPSCLGTAGPWGLWEALGP